MANETSFGFERGRTLLTVKYKGGPVKFAYPPFQGTHQECFQAISRDKELRPAEGLDLALLASSAYSAQGDEWNSVRDNFVSSYIRVPIRTLWIPHGYIEGDEKLSGVLVERDIEGNGLTTKMQVPNLSDYAEQKGIFISKDKTKTFVPSQKYELGKHTIDSFSKDGFAITNLTNEGAEIFAKTAYDIGLNLRTWGVRFIFT